MKSKVLHLAVARKSLVYTGKKKIGVMNIEVSGRKMCRYLIKRKGWCGHCEKLGQQLQREAAWISVSLFCRLLVIQKLANV